jgi:DNA-binding GntR family transcriptional regulator
LKIYEPLRLRFRVAFGLPHYYDHDRIRESVSEHLEILEAIEGGDGRTAKRLIRDHLSKGLEVRTLIFNNLSEHMSNASILNLEHET